MLGNTLKASYRTNVTTAPIAFLSLCFGRETMMEINDGHMRQIKIRHHEMYKLFITEMEYWTHIKKTQSKTKYMKCFMESCEGYFSFSLLLFDVSVLTILKTK